MTELLSNPVLLTVVILMIISVATWRGEMKLGKIIRYARTKRDMTLKELASLTGVSVSYLSLLERDKRDPSVSTISNIAKGLGVTPFLLIAGAEILDGDELEEAVGVEVAEKLAKELMSSLGRVQ